MTRDDEPDPPTPLPAVPQSPANPASVLSYRSGQVLAPTEVQFIREGDALTVIIPQGWTGFRLFMRALLPTFCGMVALIFLFIVFMLFTYGSERIGDLWCPGIASVLFVWLTIKNTNMLIYAAREGRSPSIVRAGPAGIDVHSPGQARWLDLHVPREQIADLRVHPDGFGVGNKLQLEIVTVYDSLHVVKIPWPAGDAMVELEDNVRDVLGLGPVKD